MGADNDLWGDHLNTNSDTLDALIKTVENKAGVTTFNTRTGAVTLSNADVVTVSAASVRCAFDGRDGDRGAGHDMEQRRPCPPDRHNEGGRKRSAVALGHRA